MPTCCGSRPDRKTMLSLRTARTLGLNEWKYLARSWALLPLIDRALKRDGYAVTRARLRQRADRRLGKTTPQEPDKLCVAVARAVEIAARRTLWPTSCLRQALAVEYFLAERAIACELKFGVDRTGAEGLSAHAWIERDGVVLIGGEHARQKYAVLG